MERFARLVDRRFMAKLQVVLEPSGAIVCTHHRQRALSSVKLNVLRKPFAKALDRVCGAFL